ncbi:MAG TPA: low affinity iron permease family protein [Pseudolabrys sp.]|nr:low affinity iron permease family protein [Pseudolabrys sp.]
MSPGPAQHVPSRFTRFAHAVSRFAGQPTTFLAALVLVVFWALSGPLFGYSDAWQLVINTGTTIVTFLMVFLIQNSQNRDSLEIQLKLSELILAMRGARNRFASMEDLSDEELEALHRECREQAERAGDALERRRSTVASGARTG